MLCEDYWLVKYLEDGKKTTFYIIANYKQYTEEKIRAAYGGLNPTWQILKVYPVETVEFVKPEVKK